MGQEKFKSFNINTNTTRQNIPSINLLIKKRSDKIIIQARFGATFASICNQVQMIKRCNILMIQGGKNDAAQLNNPNDTVPDLHKLLTTKVSVRGGRLNASYW